jgi:Flp pilus assembly protein TadB
MMPHGRRRLSSTVTLIFVILVLSIGASCLWLLGRKFQQNYAEYLQRIEDDAWLSTQCSDPQFISRMRQHAGVCDGVRKKNSQNQKQYVLMHHLLSLSPALVVFVVMICVATTVVLMIVVPGLLLYYRAQIDRRDRDRMLEACSPELPKHWRIGAQLMRRRIATTATDDAARRAAHVGFGAID